MTRQKRGFNLVEAAIVLGIVGLVIGGIWVAASNVMHNQRVAQLKADIVQTINRTRSIAHNQFDAICAQQGCGTNRNITPMLLAAGAIPKSYSTGTTSVLSGVLSSNAAADGPGGAKMVVTIGDWTAFGSIGKAFSIILPGLDKATCMRLVTGISGNFNDSRDLQFVESNVGQSSTIPVSLATADTLCAAQSASNYLIFYFGAV